MWKLSEKKSLFVSFLLFLFFSPLCCMSFSFFNYSLVHEFYFVFVFKFLATAHNMWDPGSPTRHQTPCPYIRTASLNRWTTREVPSVSSFVDLAPAPSKALRTLVTLLLLVAFYKPSLISFLFPLTSPRLRTSSSFLPGLLQQHTSISDPFHLAFSQL